MNNNTKPSVYAGIILTEKAKALVKLKPPFRITKAARQLITKRPLGSVINDIKEDLCSAKIYTNLT